MCSCQSLVFSMKITNECKEGVLFCSEFTDKLFKVISVSVAPTSLRAQFATEIDAEISKLNNDFLKTARDESRRIVTEETIANMMDSKEAINAQVNSVIENQAASNESIDSLSI